MKIMINPKYRDACLSKIGIAQSIDTAKHAAKLNVGLVLVSPLV